MYQKGMSVRDIEDHIRDIYGVDASASLISRITDKIMPELIEWQQRPLSEIYPVVFFDGIYPANKERLMDKTEVNMNVLNKVIAFKLLRILRNNGFIEDGKYANIERKSIQYGESIISQNKLVGR